MLVDVLFSMVLVYALRVAVTARILYNSNRSTSMQADWKIGRFHTRGRKTNKSTTVRHKFTSNRQMTDDLFDLQCENGQS